MMAFDNLSEISHSTSFEDILEYYGIETKKISSNKLLILCPFHSDSNPSLSVWINETHSSESFFCFACSKGGDAFAFVRGMEEDSFSKAMDVIKKINGIESTSTSEDILLTSVSSLSKKQQDEKRSLIAVNSQISTMYRDFLISLKQNNKVLEKDYSDVDSRLKAFDFFLQSKPSYEDLHKFFKDELTFFKKWKTDRLT